MSQVKVFVEEAIKGLESKYPAQLERFEQKLIEIFESYPHLFEQAQSQVDSLSKYGTCAIYRYGSYAWQLFQDPETNLAMKLAKARVFASRTGEGEIKAWLVQEECCMG